MIVGGHKIFFAEHFIGTAIITHINNNKDIVAANGGFYKSFSVSGGESRTFGLNKV